MPDCLLRSLQLILGGERCPCSHKVRPQRVSGFFNVPYYLISNKGYEMGPLVCSPYLRRLESLTIYGCNYKGSPFSSVILRSSVLVRLELNSQPPACQPDARPTEPPTLTLSCCNSREFTLCMTVLSLYSGPLGPTGKNFEQHCFHTF